MKKTSEFDHFTNLSNEWWDQNGKFKILHNLTPVRIKYIKKIVTLKNNNNLEILDLGCGGGLLSEPLCRLGAKVTGIDFIKNNIKIAKQHAKQSNLEINYICQNLYNLNLKKKFDVILLLEVIEHLDNWQKLIKKLDKLLKPKGKLIISTINRNLISKFFALFLAENILRWVPKDTHEYKKLVKPSELIYFLEKNNYNLIDLTGLVFNPLTFNWILKKNKNKINYFCSVIKSN